MQKKYDKINKRLVYHGQTADPKYWEKHWNEYTIEKVYPKYISKLDYVVAISKKYLLKGALVLEGGCGVGQQVFKLQQLGFQVTGIDYAAETVEFVNNHKPELNIQLGDVRKLEFLNNHFDAYWSFGVIEHFYGGYEEIALEMRRVLKHNGLLFLTFPHMSLLRKLKARLNLYEKWDNQNFDTFYQFALETKRTIDYFESIGFKLINKKGLDGAKGFKDEVPFLKPIFQKIYDGKSLPLKAINKVFSILFSGFASHSILLVLKKQA